MLAFHQGGDVQITQAADVGALVRRYRVRAGLSQEQLAERLGITRQLLSRFEQGKSDLPTSTMLRALREVDASVDVRSRAERAAIVEVPLPRVPRIELPARVWSTPVVALPRIDGAAMAAMQSAVAALMKSPNETLQVLRGLHSEDAEQDDAGE